MFGHDILCLEPLVSTFCMMSECAVILNLPQEPLIRWRGGHNILCLVTQCPHSAWPQYMQSGCVLNLPQGLFSVQPCLDPVQESTNTKTHLRCQFKMQFRLIEDYRSRVFGRWPAVDRIQSRYYQKWSCTKNKLYHTVSSSVVLQNLNSISFYPADCKTYLLNDTHS